MTILARQSKRRFLEGTVLSDKMNKTRVVQVKYLKKHDEYEKVMRVSKKYKAHDEENKTKAGDSVRMMETRPLSKDKRWTIIEVITKKAA